MCSNRKTTEKKSKIVQPSQNVQRQEKTDVPLNFLYISSHDDSIKLVGLDRHYKSGCMCITAETKHELGGWTDNKDADDNDFLCSKPTLPNTKVSSSTVKQKPLYGAVNVYQSRLPPYVSYPTYESTYERGIRAKVKPYLFHHYERLEQYIEQYRMFHSSVPYSNKKSHFKQHETQHVDPPWNPQIYRVRTPSDFKQSATNPMEHSDGEGELIPQTQSSTLVKVKPINRTHHEPDTTMKIDLSKTPRSATSSVEQSMKTDDTNEQPMKSNHSIESYKLKVNDLHTSAARLEELRQSSARLEDLQIDGHGCTSAMLTKRNVELYTQTIEDKYRRNPSIKDRNTKNVLPRVKDDKNSQHPADEQRKALTAPTEAAYSLHLDPDDDESDENSDTDDMLGLSTRSLALTRELSHSNDSIRILPAITTGKCDNLVIDSRVSSNNKHQVELYYVMDKKQKLNNALAEIQEMERFKQRQKRQQREQFSQSMENLPQRKVGTCEMFCAGGQFSLESHKLDELHPVRRIEHAATDRPWKHGRKKSKYRPLGSLVKLVKNRQKILFNNM